MLELNRVLIVGNLTRDPEMQYLPSGLALSKMTLAVNSRYVTNGEKKEDVCFIDVTAFGKLAEFSCKYFTKGRAMFVEGRLKQDTWEDKNGGGKRSKISIIADRVQFADSKPQEQPQEQTRAETKKPDLFKPAPPPVASDAVDDMDLPF